MGLAGLYNNWTSPEGETICTAAIITTEANELLASVHPRMPAVLPEDAWMTWLDPSARDRERLLSLLKPFDSREMEHYAVTSRVNSFRCNDPENIRPLAAGAEGKEPGTKRKAT
jgi:putative SOS response-associated peptidase YedK